MLYTYEYDTDYHGPALPVVEIEISSADKRENRLFLRALVDSGADVTMIPIRHLRQINAQIIDRRQIRSSANINYQVDIYAVALKIGPCAHAALEVVDNRYSSDVIVGRDVLNQMIVTLNGLANVVELSQ